jgi:hypothetical protein
LNVKPFADPPKNAKSRKGGVLPVALLGTEAFDVDDVDVSTLLLEGVAPIRHNIEDVATPVGDGDECECITDGPDGFDDLTLKFEKREIAEAIGPVDEGDIVVLTITGTLLDGTEFEASDCVWILSKREEPELPLLAGTSPAVLNPNAPNPFNPVTTITFELAHEMDVTLGVYDATGRLVEILVDGTRSAGEHSVQWAATGLASGIYFSRLKAGDVVQSRRMVLVK